MITIHITEHGREWPAEEIAALGEVFTTDAPLHGLQASLEARGYRVITVAGLGHEFWAHVEHDVPAVTGESLTDEEILATLSGLPRRGRFDGSLPMTLAEARARCAAAINARRGAR